MATTQAAGTIPASDLIHRLPSADEIRQRMDELDAELRALRTLYYAATHADSVPRRRRKPPATAQRQEARP